MATNKKAAKPASAKKPTVKKTEFKNASVYVGNSQAWESGKAIKCSADTSK